MNNKISIISPYQYNGIWVFDDERTGLDKEAFISGMDLIIDKATAHIPDNTKGFNLLFSSQPFPGYEIKLDWFESEEPAYGGNWYYCAAYDLKGWLCPALFLYFDEAPKHLYAQVLPKDKNKT